MIKEAQHNKHTSAVTAPFKVIQGQQFWYQSKACMRPLISHHFEFTTQYWSNFRFRRRVPLCNALVGSGFLNSQVQTLAL